jgi:hypothetical protein
VIEDPKSHAGIADQRRGGGLPVTDALWRPYIDNANLLGNGCHCHRDAAKDSPPRIENTAASLLHSPRYCHGSFFQPVKRVLRGVPESSPARPADGFDPLACAAIPRSSRQREVERPPRPLIRWTPRPDLRKPVLENARPGIAQQRTVRRIYFGSLARHGSTPATDLEPTSNAHRREIFL